MTSASPLALPVINCAWPRRRTCRRMSDDLVFDSTRYDNQVEDFG